MLKPNKGHTVVISANRGIMSSRPTWKDTLQKKNSGEILDFKKSLCLLSAPVISPFESVATLELMRTLSHLWNDVFFN